ncbi:MAG TPA: hypothetical protein VFA65_14990 [Bryobacteraceae bacterium]|nr:hypothetical protein [Bryobacteraceae bacterium]
MSFTQIAHRSYKLALLFLVLVFYASACFAQNPENSTTTAPPTPPPRPQFFAGTVTAIDSDQITVSRTLVGHQPDTRSFHLTPKTKLNKTSCKVNAKVTVRYQRLPEGDVAIQVLVHPPSKPPVKHP